MNDRLISESMLEVLTSVNRWKIVGSAIEPEIRPVDDPQHKKWMETNSHSHAHCEALLVLSGEACFGYRGDCYQLTPGNIFLMNGFEEHDTYYPMWSPDLDHLWLYFLQDNLILGLLSFRNGILEHKTVLVLDGPTTHWQHSLFFSANSASSIPSLDRLRAYSAATALISEIAQKGLVTKTADDHESFQRQIISAIELHIQETGGKRLNVDALAQISGYSKFHFQRLFKQYTGKRVHQYIDEYRLAAVERMFDEGYRKNEIANALGFSSLSTFSRWYRRLSI